MIGTTRRRSHAIATCEGVAPVSAATPSTAATTVSARSDGAPGMLTRLAQGDATLAELAEVTQLAKSTAHHHLAHLRAAGLVEMHGNASGYWFSIRHEGLVEGGRLLRSV